MPADRELYALRDVTATVPSIALITASIMSKKLAEGLDALVLDVKFGSGAFMKTIEQARELAHSLVETGQRMGVATTALLTDMNQPLGRMVGNAVEVDESVAALEARGPADLMEVSVALGAELLRSASVGKQDSDRSQLADPPSRKGAGEGYSNGTDAALNRIQQTIDTGAAREKLAAMVTAQGGDLDAPRKVAPASEVTAAHAGYVAAIDAELLGQAVIAMGGGRQQMGDDLDHSTGFEMLVKLGDSVEAGQPLARIFAPSGLLQKGQAKLTAAIQLADEPPPAGPLILERVA